MATFETYRIDKDQMAKVNTYLPIRAKMEWVDMIAERCLNKVQMAANLGDMNLDLPPMYKENLEYKSRYLMGVFVRLYLRGSWEVGEGEDEWLIPIDEYDKWAGGHVFAQIEKYKADAGLRDICFNCLNDFRDLTRYLNTEVANLLSIMNDPATRQIASMQMSMTPEAMERAITELNTARDALMEYESTRAQMINSDDLPGEETDEE